jgi:phospholipase/carboxylesterase
VRDASELLSVIDEGPRHGPLIILLHGRGSDERDLAPLGRLLHADATTVALRAPFDAAPWGYGPGFAWYRFLGGVTPEAVSFEAGQERLAHTLAGLSERLGRPDTRFILGGFSQGGTSALAFMMRHPGSVQAVLVFSGFLADHPSVAVTPARVADTPIFWGHGTADVAVPYDAAESGWQALRAAGARLEAHSYQGMGHTISDVELRDAAAWIRQLPKPEMHNGAS